MTQRSHHLVRFVNLTLVIFEAPYMQIELCAHRNKQLLLSELFHVRHMLSVNREPCINISCHIKSDKDNMTLVQPNH